MKKSGYPSTRQSLFILSILLVSLFSGCTSTKVLGFSMGTALCTESRLVNEKFRYLIETEEIRKNDKISQLGIRLIETKASTYERRNIYQKNRKLEISEPDFSTWSLIRWPLYPVQFAAGMTGAGVYAVSIIPRNAVAFASGMIGVIFITPAGLGITIIHNKDGELFKKRIKEAFNVFSTPGFFDVLILTLFTEDKKELDWKSPLSEFYGNMNSRCMYISKQCYRFSLALPPSPITSTKSEIEERVPDEVINGPWEPVDPIVLKKPVPGQAFNVKSTSGKETRVTADESGTVIVDLSPFAEGYRFDQFFSLAIAAMPSRGSYEKTLSFSIADIREAVPPRIDTQPANGSRINQSVILLHVMISGDTPLQEVGVSVNSHPILKMPEDNERLGYELSKKLKISLKPGKNVIFITVKDSHNKRKREEVILILEGC